MTKLSIGVGIAGVVVGLLLGSVMFANGSFGGVYTQVNNTFRDGLKVGTSDQFSVDSDGDIATDVDIDGGTFIVTTSNTATSTIVGGCFEFYATSTATAQKFQASTTPGIMYSSWGACPRL